MVRIELNQKALIIVAIFLFLSSCKTILDLATPLLILQGHNRSRKAIIDLARPYLISQDHQWSFKAMGLLARP